MIKKSKIHVRKGDNVQIISGRYKGQTGIIIKVLKKTSHVIIKNLNLKIKHVRKNQEEESGKIINFEAPIHSSNVMLYSVKNKTRSRYNTKFNENNQKYRILNKTAEIIK
jgi:large subunit ribosomal protein L24